MTWKYVYIFLVVRQICKVLFVLSNCSWRQCCDAAECLQWFTEEQLQRSLGGRVWEWSNCGKLSQVYKINCSLFWTSSPLLKFEDMLQLFLPLHHHSNDCTHQDQFTLYSENYSKCENNVFCGSGETVLSTKNHDVIMTFLIFIKFLDCRLQAFILMCLCHIGVSVSSFQCYSQSYSPVVILSKN